MASFLDHPVFSAFVAVRGHVMLMVNNQRFIIRLPAYCTQHAMHRNVSSLWNFQTNSLKLLDIYHCSLQFYTTTMTHNNMYFYIACFIALFHRILYTTKCVPYSNC